MIEFQEYTVNPNPFPSAHCSPPMLYFFWNEVGWWGLTQAAALSLMLGVAPSAPLFRRLKHLSHAASNQFLCPPTHGPAPVPRAVSWAEVCLVSLQMPLSNQILSFIQIPKEMAANYFPWSCPCHLPSLHLKKNSFV